MARKIDLLYNPQTFTEDITLIADNDYVRIDATTGAVVVTLPDALEYLGKEFVVKKIDSSGNSVTLQSTELIEGQATYALSVQYQMVRVISVGDSWEVLGY